MKLPLWQSPFIKNTMVLALDSHDESKNTQVPGLETVRIEFEIGPSSKILLQASLHRILDLLTLVS